MLARFRRPALALVIGASGFCLMAADSCDTGATTTTAPAAAQASSSPTATAAPAVHSPTAAPSTPVATPAPPAPTAAPPAATDPHQAAKDDGATAICNDGTYSFSASRSGTCSHHGGVQWWTGKVGAEGPG